MPLYVHDFLHGTRAFSNEELGAYVRLLLQQWEYAAVPGDDQTALAALLQDSPRRAQQLWSRIGPKFHRDSEGRWRNPRCERERAGAVEFSRRQQARARARWHLRS